MKSSTNYKQQFILYIRKAKRNFNLLVNTVVVEEQKENNKNPEEQQSKVAQKIERKKGPKRATV